MTTGKMTTGTMSTPTRVAAIDCGTNSIRLLICEDAPGGPREVYRRLELVRLGQGVDATGAFHPDALARTFAAIEGFASVIADAGVERLRFVATSAARDVENRAEFERGVRDRLGVEVEVISGAEEARLSFAGALAVLEDAPEPVLVTDIGGGSTELVLGKVDGTVTAARSLDVGSVRLRERLLRSDPIHPDERRAAEAHIDLLLARCDVPVAEAATWIGVAGTMTSMAALWLGLEEYDRSRVHGARLTSEQIAEITDRLVTTRVADLVGPMLPPLRAQVIAAGAVVCSRIATRCGVDLIVSETDILDAVAHELLRSD